METHKYWAVLIIDTQTPGNHLSLGEIQLRATQGGANLAGQAGSVSATSELGGFPVSNLVDGVTSTRWAASTLDPTNQRITFYYPSPTTVAEVALYLETSNQCPKNLRLEFSDDGITFTSAGQYVNTANSGWVTFAVQGSTPPDPNAPQKTTLNLSVAGATGWTNPSYLTASGGNYAYRSLGNTSNYNATFNSNAASALPADAVILGVEVSYKAYVDTTGPATRVFTSYPTSPESYPTTSEVLYTKGGPTNKLGVNSAADIAGPWLRVSNTAGGTATLYVNSFSIAVYWRIPAAGNPLFFGEMF